MAPQSITPLCEVCGQPVRVNTGDANRYCGVACYRASQAAEARFWTRVDRGGPPPSARPALGPCWLWQGKLTTHGYGRFYVDGRDVDAHRWGYLHLVGPLADGIELDHLCRVRRCVNPCHLEPVTRRENIRRGERVGVFGTPDDRCIYGHLLDAANTYVRPTGSIQCRACDRRRAAAYRRRRAGQSR